MTDTDTFTAKLDPRREAVHALMATAVEYYDDENPGQMFADFVMSMSIMAHVWEADISNIQVMFDAAEGNARKAAEGLDRAGESA